MTNLVLVESNDILRNGLRALLELEDDIRIVGEASDCDAAIELLSQVPSAQVILTEILWSQGNGMEFVAKCKAAHPEILILVLTDHCTEEYIRAALAVGADGYILKDASRFDLLSAIRIVAEGNQYFSKSVNDLLISGFLNRSPVNDPAQEKTILTGREREVLVLIAEGNRNKTIASSLNVSVKTVEKHRANLMRKLQLRNAAEIARYAVEAGLLEAETRSRQNGFTI